jgi:hypothetical protein
MFAKSSDKENYHLLQPDEERTLCGYEVAPIIIDRKVNVSALHLTKIRPVGYELCEACAAAASEQQQPAQLSRVSTDGESTESLPQFTRR